MAAEEQWSQCCEWLKRVGLIGSDHLLATNQARLSDLCRFLRDGVMLCKLLHLLDKNSIDLRSINQRPQKAQFLCMKNISIFLQTCEQKFGIHKDDLFDPEMLFESLDFKKVLHTLSKLSICPRAQRLHIQGFFEERCQNGSDNEIYETLSRDMANGPAGDGHGPGIKGQEAADDLTIYSALNLEYRRQPEEEEDVIYDDVVELSWLQHSTAYLNATIPRPEAPDLCRKRDLCLQELIETEHNYVEALNMLCRKFLEPLRRVLNEEQIKKIFGKIPELYRIHQVLHKGLKEAQNNNSAGKSIADVFLENQERLIIYAEYCASLASAQQELEDVMNNNEEAKNLIQECQNEVNEGRHQLKGYLVVPLQRILKYHLLLQELDRHSQPFPSSDLGDLKSAHEAMKDLAEYINEAKRDREMLQIIQDLQNSILDMPSEINDWQNLGKLRHDGETKIERHSDPVRKRYVFIFDKVMVICSKQTKDEKYIFKDSVKLENCHIDNSVAAVQGGSTKGRHNSFFLVVDVNKTVYTILTKDSDSKERWMKHISDAIEYLNPAKNREMEHKFSITTFSKLTTRCMICSKLLKGTIFQGYSCSRCKMVVHRSCLDGVQRCEGRARRESPIPPSHPPIIRRPSDPYPGYGNLQLMNFPWWVERMTREEAKRQLELLPDETFLIRWSERHQKLVLSLKVKHDDVKHMRILKHEEANSFYLSEARYFRTVEALVNYYRQNSLSECFSDLFSTLSRPLYDTAVVKFPYQGPGANYLSLELDDRVIITSHDGESTGWWKGRIGNRVGYFPKEFVQVENNFNMRLV
ncbi:protein vav-like isoform X4 [Portunus trituberculatus]|uniref:protein vav-like isoform X4 n=1 Tax=Portunus trituberculatus TaxID=210409 RepID=UPI001E1CD067|nr:protein vav-like isoform X4 [Portunus trituberculatus]